MANELTKTVSKNEMEMRQWCISLSQGANAEEKISSAQKLFEWITTNTGISVVDGSGSPIK